MPVFVVSRPDCGNFIHCPRPLIVKVVDVAPSEPPKLYDLVTHILSYADLPPIVPILERIDLKKLVRGAPPSAFLVPCRSGGAEDLGAPVRYLDERPPAREDWTLIGCERSLQFHRHYYGDEPPRVEMCPRAIAGRRSEPTMLKCCLLEFDIERDGEMMIVPWGADLPMVERALRALSTQKEARPRPSACPRHASSWPSAAPRRSPDGYSAARFSPRHGG